MVVAAVGVVLVAAGALMPVEYVVRRAIPQAVLREIVARGDATRVAELRDNLRASLKYERVALALLGCWLVALAVGWRAIRRWDGLRQAGAESEQTHPALRAPLQGGESSLDHDLRRVASSGCWTGRELAWPALWCLVAVALGFPLLFKGFEHTELLNYLMLAKRGPVVAAVCQNLPPRAAQPAYSIVESISVRLLGDGEFAARLPALLFGALAMFPLYVIARRLGSAVFANLACMAFAGTGFFLFYATYGRGYSLSMLGYLCALSMALGLRECSGATAWRMSPSKAGMEQDSWARWWLMGLFCVIACYAHLATCLYVAVLGIVLATIRVVDADKTGGFIRAAAAAKIKVLVVFGTVFLVVLALYAIGIPMELRYMRTFDLTNYYMSYHLDARFAKVMAESWSLVRDVPAVGWMQAGLAVAGAFVLFRMAPAAAGVLIVPAVVACAAIWAKNLFVYPRFFLHFLPVYVLLWVFAVWGFARIWRQTGERIGAVILALLICAGAGFSVGRLYSMERCGVRTAVEDAGKIMAGGRIMGVLDGFVTVRHYHPAAVSGYHSADFWKELNSTNPPEFVVMVPYADMDIPGALAEVRAKYSLVRKYPGWLDVDDDQDSVELYAR